MPLNRLSRLRSRRGGSLMEVLVAMAILAMLMVGVLQLFSLALVTDSGSAARSDMSLKAQQIAENLRYLHFLRSTTTFAVPDGRMLVAPTNGASAALPYQSSGTGWAYWGPLGANVIEEENPPYRASYSYSTSTTPGFLFLTVTVTSAVPSGTSMSYVGDSAKVKRVDYVCQVPN